MAAVIGPKEPPVRTPEAEFNRSRATVYARSGGRCERCRRTDATQVHHRSPRGMGGARARWVNMPANLVHLCTDCHGRIESDRDLSVGEGWLIRHGQARAITTPILWWFEHKFMNVWHQSWATLDDEGQVWRLSDQAAASLGATR